MLNFITAFMVGLASVPLLFVEFTIGRNCISKKENRHEPIVFIFGLLLFIVILLQILYAITSLDLLGYLVGFSTSGFLFRLISKKNDLIKSNTELSANVTKKDISNQSLTKKQKQAPSIEYADSINSINKHESDISIKNNYFHVNDPIKLNANQNLPEIASYVGIRNQKEINKLLLSGSLKKNIKQSIKKPNERIDLKIITCNKFEFAQKKERGYRKAPPPKWCEKDDDKALEIAENIWNATALYRKTQIEGGTIEEMTELDQLFAKIGLPGGYY